MRSSNNMAISFLPAVKTVDQIELNSGKDAVSAFLRGFIFSLIAFCFLATLNNPERGKNY